MKNIFNNLFSSPKKDEQTIIAKIHNEFDTAQDRLLQQANEILGTLKIDDKTSAEEKAKRLERIGFINTPLVKQVDVIKQKRIETEQQIVKTKSEAELIQHYKFHYPFLKFLTENELDRICKKI